MDDMHKAFALVGCLVVILVIVIVIAFWYDYAKPKTVHAKTSGNGGPNPFSARVEPVDLAYGQNG